MPYSTFLLMLNFLLPHSQFDPEGFGEISVSEFVVALKSPEFLSQVPMNKRELLLERAKKAQLPNGPGYVTFQDFVNVVSASNRIPMCLFPLSRTHGHGHESRQDLSANTGAREGVGVGGRQWQSVGSCSNTKHNTNVHAGDEESSTVHILLACLLVLGVSCLFTLCGKCKKSMRPCVHSYRCPFAHWSNKCTFGPKGHASLPCQRRAGPTGCLPAEWLCWLCLLSLPPSHLSALPLAMSVAGEGGGGATGRRRNARIKFEVLLKRSR